MRNSYKRYQRNKTMNFQEKERYTSRSYRYYDEGLARDSGRKYKNHNNYMLNQKLDKLIIENQRLHNRLPQFKQQDSARAKRWNEQIQRISRRQKQCSQLLQSQNYFKCPQQHEYINTGAYRDSSYRNVDQTGNIPKYKGKKLVKYDNYTNTRLNNNHLQFYKQLNNYNQYSPKSTQRYGTRHKTLYTQPQFVEPNLKSNRNTYNINGKYSYLFDSAKANKKQIGINTYSPQKQSVRTDHTCNKQAIEIRENNKCKDNVDKKIDCKVYLQEQTFIGQSKISGQINKAASSDNQQPVYVDDSFGNQNKVSCQSNLASQNKNAQNYILREKSKIRNQIQFPQEKKIVFTAKKQNYYQRKKTNYPYINNDFKLTEPKTQLKNVKKIFEQSKPKQKYQYSPIKIENNFDQQNQQNQLIVPQKNQKHKSYKKNKKFLSLASKSFTKLC